jgi:hypothetical protein
MISVKEEPIQVWPVVSLTFDKMKKHITLFLLLITSLVASDQERFHKFKDYSLRAVSSNVIFIITWDSDKEDYFVSDVIAGTPDIRKIQTEGSDPKWKEVVRAVFMKRPESFKWPHHVAFFQKEVAGRSSYENQGITNSSVKSTNGDSLSPEELVDFIKKARDAN